MELSEKELTDFEKAVHDRQNVSGHTHAFYRYPARFSPHFAGAAIEKFTAPGDLVLDPFMGGGTTLVESQIRGRYSIGFDISSLATFLAQVKTTLLSARQLDSLRQWAMQRIPELSCHSPAFVSAKWVNEGYQRNINCKQTWPIRKTLEQAISQLRHLKDAETKKFARCALLKTGQWALDCKQEIPSSLKFRVRLQKNLLEMCDQIEVFGEAVIKTSKNPLQTEDLYTKTYCRSAEEISSSFFPPHLSAPKLVLTSPPYPGVHVLYHRWQIFGRRETPAPFWLVNRQDGHGGSFYTMGGRHKDGLPDYFEQTLKIFTSLASVADDDTRFVQMLSFSEPSWQLPRYLQVLEEAGLREEKHGVFSNSSDGRLWRRVPNRRWYADQQEDIPSSEEVVLFHRLA